MSLGRGLRYIFADPNWIVKVLIGSLLTLVPILNFAATGYMFEVVREVAAGRDTPLPEWNNFGDKLLRGFIGAVIGFLWTLPVLILACPMGIIAGVSGSNAPDGTPSTSASLAIGCLGILVLMVSLALTPLALAAQARYAVTNDFSAALPGAVLQQVRSNLGAWLSMFGALIGIGVGVGIVAALLIVVTVGLALCLLVPLAFVFGFYYVLAQAHWMGQAYRISTGNPSLPPRMV